MSRPSKARDVVAEVRSDVAPAVVSVEASVARPKPTIEAMTNGTDHNLIVIRDRAINLRDNLVRVADGARLERARDLLTQVIAVALGKD